ncbi:hypothetical protein, partial [Treponema saccharophilum]|uniref:hypothetical protein n=1 Tax=Treponema saccharophilum TaxID=165 RepID=UPI003867189D
NKRKKIQQPEGQENGKCARKTRKPAANGRAFLYKAKSTTLIFIKLFLVELKKHFYRSAFCGSKPLCQSTKPQP